MDDDELPVVVVIVVVVGSHCGALCLDERNDADDDGGAKAQTAVNLVAAREHTAAAAMKR